MHQSATTLKLSWSTHGDRTWVDAKLDWDLASFKALSSLWISALFQDVFPHWGRLWGEELVWGIRYVKVNFKQMPEPKVSQQSVVMR